MAPNASADGIEQGVSMKYGKEAAKLFAQRIHADLTSPFTVSRAASEHRNELQVPDRIEIFTSVIGENHSLLVGKKFPVPMRREFRCKSLELLLKQTRQSAKQARIRRIPC